MALLIDPLVVLYHAALELADHTGVVQLQVALQLGQPVGDQLGFRLSCNQRVLVGQVPRLPAALLVAPVEGRPEVWMEGCHHLRQLAETVPDELLLPYFPQPPESLSEEDEGLHPHSPMLMEDGETDELFLGGVIDGEFVGSEGLIDSGNSLFRQMLLKVLLIDNKQFEFGLSGRFAEMAHPQLSEEGTRLRRSLQIDPQLARQRLPLLLAQLFLSHFQDRMLLSQQKLVKETFSHHCLALDGLINKCIQLFHRCQQCAESNEAEFVL
jgi:hypothetical protein